VIAKESLIAVVTGGASGLGLACVRRLIERGSRVAIVDRRGSSGGEIAASLGARAMFTPADVSSGAEVAQALEAITSTWGPARALVCCAGVGTAMRLLGPLGPARLDDFVRTLQINLVGTFNCIRLVAAQMATQSLDDEGERGVIVTTSSIAGTEGQVGQAAYAASKAGIAGMTLPLARELAEHAIRIVCIAPGVFETPMTERAPEALRQALDSALVHPRRFGRADEFAGLVEHALENSMLNGVTLRLDGALRLPPR
jgi:NAD(P)-dependent dehydrogenase (short-subunit alcohol dehydrogenase family)